MTCRLSLILAVLASLVLQASAQVTVSLRFQRSNFLAGESIPVSVSITNLSGRELTFAGSTRRPWMDFIVSSTRGVPLTLVGKPAFGAVKIPAGQTLAKTIDLSQLYAFSELGNFSVYAIARLPGQQTGGYQSNRHLFNISSAAPYWKQSIGVPGRSNKINEFRLIRFTASRKTQLYAQVADEKTGRILQTHPLGETLTVRKPTVSVDKSLNMHVLYMVTPKFWGHARVTPTGEFLGRDLYRPTGFDPGLARMPDGSIKVVGGVKYDAEAERREMEKKRKASDRPAFIYD